MDEDAWAESAEPRWASIYQENLLALRRTVSRILRASGHRSSADGDDIVQSAFLKVIARSVDEQATVPYLFVAAKNIAHDLVRRRRIEARAAAMLSTEHEEAVLPIEKDMRPVRALLAKLSSELRTVYVTRFEDGLPQLVAARKMGISRQRMRTLERRLCNEVAQVFVPRSTQT